MPLTPIDSYDSLVAAIVSFSEDMGGELLEYLPVAIDNAENRLARELDFLGQDYVSAPITVSPNATTIQKPSGHKATYFIEALDSSGNSYVVDRKQDGYLIEYGTGLAPGARLKYYSDLDDLTFRVAPRPSQAVQVVVHGVRRPLPHLAPTSQTNTYTALAPDALFYACMLELAIWQRNPNLKAEFEALYVACRDSINNEGRRQRRDDGSPVGNPEAGRNTLLGGQTNQ